MPGPVPHPDDPARSASSGLSTPRPPMSDLLADLVAHGEVGLPAGSSDEEQEQLVRSARQRLRHRILQYVASQVALDLWRAAQSTE